MGVAAAAKIISELRAKHLGRTVVLAEVWGTVKSTLKELLKGEDDTVWNPDQPLSPLKFAERKTDGDSRRAA